MGHGAVEGANNVRRMKAKMVGEGVDRLIKTGAKPKVAQKGGKRKYRLVEIRAKSEGSE